MGLPGDAVMLDTFRTLLAKFIVQYLNRPRPLVIGAWFWLAAQTDDIEEVTLAILHYRGQKHDKSKCRICKDYGSELI